ncbi:hypothetical protein [Ferviditalea candida]|uniref:Uncharacterized protein n=1 Tax=Ferviditalea candida TaxID=3108399 RepID=A0ABU5ZKW0_9BACL|nr:hypothetical protein [Paenibacillaceae bacterium T2]
MDKLDLILQKLVALEEGQKEWSLISRAIQNRQDETDAKLEAMAMDVHQLHGKLEAQNEKLNAIADELHTFRRETKSNFRQLEGHMRLFDNDLDEALERINQLESRT